MKFRFLFKLLLEIQRSKDGREPGKNKRAERENFVEEDDAPSPTTAELKRTETHLIETTYNNSAFLVV